MSFKMYESVDDGENWDLKEGFGFGSFPKYLASFTGREFIFYIEQYGVLEYGIGYLYSDDMWETYTRDVIWYPTPGYMSTLESQIGAVQTFTGKIIVIFQVIFLPPFYQTDIKTFQAESENDGETFITRILP